MMTDGTQKPESPKSAARDVATDLARFDPLKFFRTVMLVAYDQEEIADALSKQNWDRILSPLKYFSTCLTILLAVFWLTKSGNEGDTLDPAWSPSSPVFWEIIGLIVLPFIVVQYIVLARNAAIEAASGVADGLAKLLQCYALVMGSAMLTMSVVAVGSYLRIKIAFIATPLGYPIAFILIVLPGLLSMWIVYVLPGMIVSLLFKTSKDVAKKAIGWGCTAAFIGFVIFGYINGLL
jgi:hypothetical protein